MWCPVYHMYFHWISIAALFILTRNYGRFPSAWHQRETRLKLKFIIVCCILNYARNVLKYASTKQYITCTIIEWTQIPLPSLKTHEISTKSRMFVQESIHVGLLCARTRCYFYMQMRFLRIQKSSHVFKGFEKSTVLRTILRITHCRYAFVFPKFRMVLWFQCFEGLYFIAISPDW